MESLTPYDDSHFQRLNVALDDFNSKQTGLSAALPFAPGMPTQLGAYSIVELIGEGGMGSVFKAEQRRPVRRTVAIKLVKPGLDTREVLSRFDAERQALARMDHPGIAKVLDAGADNIGRPYFVMEYVDGKPITKFANDNQLTLRERLELFCQVCDAIAHAHTKAIMHRDIKASNVLAYVSEGAHSVKVIDFGVAKALSGDRLTDITFSTDRGQIVGTYDSMSPEQADGSRDIDTRTDVYSLGVLLYELLAGFKPIDKETLNRANDQEVRRIIREVEPPRPSARLASLDEHSRAQIAAARKTRFDTLVRDLRHELEWIPLMALRKERERRYASSLALAADVRNYLAGRPLVAGPESGAYITKKFIARHRVAVAGSVLLIALLAGGITFYLHRIRAEQQRTLAALARSRELTELAEQQRRRAESESAVSTNVKDFVADMLRALNPARARGRVIRLEDVVRESASRIEKQFKDQPDVESQLRTELGQTMLAIGHAEEALPHLERALELVQQQSGADSKAAIFTESRIGDALTDLGRYREAEPLYRAMVDRCERLFKADDPALLQAQHRLGHVLSVTDRPQDAEKLFRTVYERRLRLSGPEFGPDGIETLRAQSNLGLVLSRLGARDEAETMLRTALERRLRISDGSDDPEISRLKNNLSSHLTKIGQREEAAELTRESLEMARRIYPEGHPDLVATMANYVFFLQNERRSVGAEALAREAYSAGLQVIGPDHPQTIRAQLILHRVLAETGRTDEALKLARDALDRRRRLYGPDHAETHDAMRALTSALMRAKQPDEAMQLMREMVASARRMYGNDARETVVSLAHQALYLRDAKRFAEAEPLFAEILRIVKANPHYMTQAEVASYSASLALAIKEQRRFDEAKPLLEAAVVDLQKSGLQMRDRMTLNCLNALAEIAESQGDLDRAARLRAEATRATPATRPTTARTFAADGETVRVRDADYTYPAAITSQIGGQRTPLVITGTALRKKSVFKVYTVASYVADGVAVRDAADLASLDVAKQFHLVMQRNLDGSTIADGFIEAIHLNYPKDQFVKQKQQLLDFMQSAELKSGDDVWLTHIPAVGLHCTLPGGREITIDDVAFAVAIWQIYLGQHNIDEVVKADLTSRLPLRERQ